MKNAARVAAAFAIAAALVVLGLQVAVDDTSGRTLHGRAGEVHVP